MTASDARLALLAHLTKLYAFDRAGVVAFDVQTLVVEFNELLPLFAAYERSVAVETMRDAFEAIWYDVEERITKAGAEATEPDQVARLDVLRHWARRERAKATRP